MNGFPTRAEVENLRQQYPAGTRIRLIRMDDYYAKLKIGDLGTVVAVDDAGQLVMSWDNGSGLSLIPGVDDFEKV